MRTLKTPFHSVTLSYPLDTICPLSDLIFVDIETTGFSAATSSLYLIGCVYFSKETPHLIQWFAETPSEEREVLKAFFEFISAKKLLIHFNGNTFDLPFLTHKCEQYDLPYSLEDFDGIDLYRRITPYRDLLGVPDCKQRTLEEFLDIHREDPFQGGELIQVYKNYLQEPTDVAFQLLLQHNADDMQGMLSLLPLLSYSDLFAGNIKIKKAQANHYQDQEGIAGKELLLKGRPFVALPKPISLRANDCYFYAENCEFTLRVPIYEEEMKYFYSNYQDYYYLPEEDTALHKSVASFVDKAHREKAHAANCYTRKSATYLPQWDVLFTPFFKRDYEAKELFFELTEERKSDRMGFSLYATHVLDVLFQTFLQSKKNIT